MDVKTCYTPTYVQGGKDMAECEMYGVFIKQIHDELEKQIEDAMKG